MDVPAILISIKPQYALPIIEGAKSHEYRRSLAKRNFGYMAIYASLPIQKIIGLVKINRVIADCPKKLFNIANGKAGIAEDEYNKYFLDKSIGYAFEVGDIHKFDSGLDPKLVWEDFTPPQSFNYIDKDKFEILIEKAKYDTKKIDFHWRCSRSW